MINNNHNTHLRWMDNLRVLATVSVIVLHVSADLMYDFGPAPHTAWWIGNIYDSAMRFCVPVFVMITGALLLQEEYPWRVFYKKRFLRLIPPFVFWNLAYLAYSWFSLLSRGEHMTLQQTGHWLMVKLWTEYPYHFWYVYMIMGMYLFMPLVKAIVRKLSEKGIQLFLIAWTLLLFLNYYKPDDFPVYISNSLFVGYLVLGYYLTTKNFVNLKRVNMLAVLFIILGLFITIFGTYFITASQGWFSGTFYFYLTPNVLMVASGVFLLFKNHPVRVSANSQVLKVKALISKYSYGIYLAHVLVLSILAKFGVDSIMVHALVDVPLTSIICLNISLISVYIINRFPFGKYISG